MPVLLMFFISKLEFEAQKMEIIREGAGRVTHLVGGVHLYDEKLDIKGAEAWFNPGDNTLSVAESLRIKAQDVDITADSLLFDTRDRVSHLYRRVVVTKDETEIRAPVLDINHRSRTARIPYGAEIRDMQERILITGDEATYDLGAERGTIARNPVLRQDSDSSDFEVTSQRMHLDQGSRSASAAGGVRIVTEDATVYSDTMTLYYDADWGNASGNVRIENPEGVISADSSKFTLFERRIEEIDLYPWVTTRYRTEDEDSVVVTSPYLKIDTRRENNEMLIFTGGASGTYYWKEQSQTEE